MAEEITPPANPPANPPQNEPPPPTAEELLAQARKEKLEAQAEADRVKKENEDLKLQGLKSKDDWKAIAELEKQRADAAEGKLTNLNKALQDSAKYGAIKAEAQKQGINPISIPDLELLDFSEVTVESINGRVIVSGVEGAIQGLKQKRPNWFSNGVPSINPTTPAGGQAPATGQVTLADVKAAEQKYYQTKSESDKQAYQNLVIKFKQQG
jgi:hypothetical protein